MHTAMDTTNRAAAVTTAPRKTVEYLAPKDVQQLLKIKKTTFYAWLKQGKLPPPALSVGGVKRWSIDDVARFYRDKMPDVSNARH